MPGKYHVAAKSARTHKGVIYDSAAEMQVAAELDVLYEYGQIDWWLRQVAVDLGPDHRVRIDFLVCEDGRVRGVEVKGAYTRQWARVRKLWRKYGPFPLDVIIRGKLHEILERERPHAQAQPTGSSRPPAIIKDTGY